MKFLATFLLALAGTTALAMPAPEADALAMPAPAPKADADAFLEERAALEKRQSCKRVRRFLRDQWGVCVDTRGANSCSRGALYTGLCPGTPNHVLCCIN